jgi:hypothetical protein
MKWTRNISILLAIVVFSAAEISAQTKSSAAQVVTFGVRRIALQIPAAAIASNNTNRTYLKVTVGALSQVQSAVEIGSANSSKKSSSVPSALLMRAGNRVPMDATRESNVYTSKSLLASSLPPAKLFVTLTE